MWVVTRFRLQMERYPRVGESVTVETWASTRTNGLRAHREFLFLDSSGAVLGRANSIWLLLDVSRKRPVRLPQVILDICNPERSDRDEFEIPRLQRPANPSSGKVFEVGWKDLDSNNHANNVNYIEWALETLPLETRRDQKLVQLDVEFLSQAFHSDKVTSEVEIAGRTSIHQLTNSSETLLSLVVARFG
jgi:acyl-ACP thioesterase